MDRRNLTLVFLALAAVSFLLIPDDPSEMASDWPATHAAEENASATVKGTTEELRVARLNPGRTEITGIVDPQEEAYRASLPLFPSFFGTLHQPDGSPARECTVTAHGMKGNAWFMEPNQHAEVTWITNTDSRGRFHFPEIPQDGLRFLLLAEHGSLPALEKTNLPARPGQSHDIGIWTFQKPGTLRGQVLSEDGTPLLDAQILAYREALKGISGTSLVNKTPAIANLEARTSADGTFTFTGLPPGRLNFSADAPGFLKMTSPPVVIQASDSAEALVFELSRGEVLFGEVHDAQGQAIPDVHARLWWSANDTPDAIAGNLQATTDEHGAFQFDYPAELSKARLQVTSKNHWVVLQSLNTYQLGEIQNIELQPLGALEGYVFSANGTTVENASVGLFSLEQSRDRRADPRQSEPLVTVSTSKDGSYSLLPIMTGKGDSRFRLSAWHPDHGATFSSSFRMDRGPSRIPNEINLHLDVAGGISGKVLLPDGSPATAAQVHLRRLYRRPGGNGTTSQITWQAPGKIYQSTRTSADGSFTFQGAPSALWRVEAYAKGTAPGKSEDFETSDGIAWETDIQLFHPATIEGEVLGNINAFHGLRVYIQASEMDEVEVRVQGNGRFLFQNLPPADYEIRTREVDAVTEHVFGQSFPSQESLTPVQTVELSEGESQNIILELMLEGRGSLQGVVFQNGLPAPNFGISLFPEESGFRDEDLSINNIRLDLGGFRSTTTDYQGRYQLSGVLSGEYWAILTQSNSYPGHGFGSRKNEPPKGLSRVQIDLPPGEEQIVDFSIQTGEFRGFSLRATEKGDQPARGYARLMPASTSEGLDSFWTSIKRDGSFHFDNVVAGLWTLRLDSGNWNLRNIPIQITADSTLEETFYLQRRAKKESKEKKKESKKEKP